MIYALAQRRASERFYTELAGQIVSADGFSSVECIVWDISTTGARIRSSHPAEIPLTFELQVPEEEASAQVRLIWSTGNEHGVMFVDKLTPSS
jgi:PilZ domain